MISAELVSPKHMFYFSSLHCFVLQLKEVVFNYGCKFINHRNSRLHRTHRDQSRRKFVFLSPSQLLRLTKNKIKSRINDFKIL